MSGSLTLALLSAQSGLSANQIGLDTVTNNITNVNTAEYSRKIVQFESRAIAGAGAGVKVGEIIRRVDEGLLKSVRLELSQMSELSIQTTYFSRVQELFGSPADNSSLAHLVSEYTNALESLANSPEKNIDQTEVVRWAEDIINKLSRMDDTIQEMRRQADQAIGDAIDESNQLITRIGDMNDKIIKNQSSGRDVSDLQDQRDAAINRLSEIMDVRYFFRSDGDIVVFTSSGRTLVDSVPGVLTHVPVSSVDSTFTHASGEFAGIYLGSTSDSSNDITNGIRSGELAGLVTIRDNILANLQNQIDEFAASLRDTVNQNHNRGIPFPGLQTMTGTRTFIAPTTQTITLDAANGVDDVTIALFNSTGDEQAKTTLETIMTSAVYGTAASAANGPWTITEVAVTIQDWLQANGAATASVSVATDDHFNISLNSSTLNLAFRDQTAAADGSTHEDAAIGFDADGDGNIDETVNGFSYFFGLNDFFDDGLPDNIYESDVLASTFTASAATLTFRDSSGALTGSPLTVTAGESLETIAANINSTIADLTASVVPDGNGYRLRISHDSGKNMTITQGVGDTFLTNVGIHKGDVRVAGTLAMRADILAAPSLVTRGNMQWDSTIGANGEYYLSVGDGSNVRALAEAMKGPVSFKTAGGIANTTISFNQYSTIILSRNANLAATNESQFLSQETLTNSLRAKSDSVRGVNLDEEMSQLILFEQAYIAATRIISVVQKMLDALERVI